MSKCLKIVLAIFLSLVIIAGATVGIITQGFRKWDKLKDNKITNFYHNGKNGVSADTYNNLQDDYTDLDNLLNCITTDKIYSNLDIKKDNYYSGLSVETGNDAYILYSLNYKKDNGFVGNSPISSAYIKDLKTMFTKTNVRYEYRSYTIFAVYPKNDFKKYNGSSCLSYFSVLDYVIINDYISRKDVTFNIVYGENITSEQKALIEAGIDENTEFDVNFFFDLKKDDYTNLYTINVSLFVEKIANKKVV